MWVNKENSDWKEEINTIPQELRMEEVIVENEKINKSLPNISTPGSYI